MVAKNITNSFKYALRGLTDTYVNERNFRIHTWVSFVVLIAGIFFGVTIKEWIIIVLVITMVLILELMNTVVERIIDILKPKIHEYVRVIKDITAAAVLVASISAVVIGLIIFYPYVISIFD